MKKSTRKASQVKAAAAKKKAHKPLPERVTEDGLEVATRFGWALVRSAGRPAGWPEECPVVWEFPSIAAAESEMPALPAPLGDWRPAIFKALRSRAALGHLMAIKPQELDTPGGRRKLARLFGQSLDWDIYALTLSLDGAPKLYTCSAREWVLTGLLAAILHLYSNTPGLRAGARERAIFTLGELSCTLKTLDTYGMAMLTELEDRHIEARRAGRSKHAADDSLKIAQQLADRCEQIAETKSHMGYKKTLYAAADDMKISESTARKHMDLHPWIKDQLKQRLL